MLLANNIAGLSNQLYIQNKMFKQLDFFHVDENSWKLKVEWNMLVGMIKIRCGHSGHTTLKLAGCILRISRRNKLIFYMLIEIQESYSPVPTNIGGCLLSLIMGMASAKFWSAKGVSHQPAFMGSCLTISHMCLPSHVFASCISDVQCLFFFRKMRKLSFQVNMGLKLITDLGSVHMEVSWSGQAGQFTYVR